MLCFLFYNCIPLGVLTWQCVAIFPRVYLVESALLLLYAPKALTYSPMYYHKTIKIVGFYLFIVFFFAHIEHPHPYMQIYILTEMRVYQPVAPLSTTLSGADVNRCHQDSQANDCAH